MDTKRIATFLEGKRLIVHHRDGDGITSAALFLRSYPGAVLALDSPGLGLDLETAIKEEKPDVVVFLDLAIDRYHEQLKELEQQVRLVIIDHHVIDHDLSSDRTIFINPRLEDPHAYLSTSYLVYHLLEALGKPQPAWIAGIGVISDYAFREGKDVLAAVEPELVEGDPRSSRLGQGGKLISAAITVAGERGAKRVLQLLLDATSFSALEDDEQLNAWKTQVEEEITRVVGTFEEKREFIEGKNVAIFELESPLSITSAVSTILGEQHPDLVIVIKRKDDEGWKLSFRNQSGRVNLHEIVSAAAQGIGTGGGHEKAAGAFVTDWDEFKKRFLALVK